MRLGRREVRTQLERRRAHVRARCLVGRDLVQGSRERTQIRQLVAKLVEPKQVGERTRGAHLGAKPRRECVRLFLRRDGEDGERKEQGNGGEACVQWASLRSEAQRLGPLPHSLSEGTLAR